MRSLRTNFDQLAIQSMHANYVRCVGLGAYRSLGELVAEVGTFIVLGKETQGSDAIVGRLRSGRAEGEGRGVVYVITDSLVNIDRESARSEASFNYRKATSATTASLKHGGYYRSELFKRSGAWISCRQEVVLLFDRAPS